MKHGRDWRAPRVEGGLNFKSTAGVPRRPRRVGLGLVVGCGGLLRLLLVESASKSRMKIENQDDDEAGNGCQSRRVSPSWVGDGEHGTECKGIFSPVPYLLICSPK